MTFLKTLMIAMLFAVSAHAADGGALAKAKERLLRVEEFALGGVGMPPGTSQGELDLRVVIVSGNPKAELQDLFERGNIQCKCYALAGFHFLDKKSFEALAAALEKEKSEVRTMRGCIVMGPSVKFVVKEIRAGEYDSYFEQKKGETSFPQ